MLRIGRLTIVGALSFCWLLACGDKINPQGNYPTRAGGTGGAPSVGIDGGPSVDSGPPPSFTYDIMPLLTKGCLCHVQGGQMPLLDTYPNVKANANASLRSMQNATMPLNLPPLPESEIDLFQSWINAAPPTPNN